MIEPLTPMLIGFLAMGGVICLGFAIRLILDALHKPLPDPPFEPPIIPKKTVHYPRQLTKKERKRNPKQYTTLYKENPNG